MEPPFDMPIMRMIACGKTSYLLEMLEKNYKNHFDYIILICPTFDCNKSYQEWKYINDPDFLTIQCKHEQVDIILKHVSDVYKGISSPIILDDCASSQDVKNRVSELVRLAFSARHYNLCTFIVTSRSPLQLNHIVKIYQSLSLFIIQIETALQ